MSSAWADCWGDSWGETWGAAVVPPVIILPPGGGALVPPQPRRQPLAYVLPLLPLRLRLVIYPVAFEIKRAPRRAASLLVREEFERLSDLTGSDRFDLFALPGLESVSSETGTRRGRKP